LYKKINLVRMKETKSEEHLRKIREYTGWILFILALPFMLFALIVFIMVM